MKKKKEWHESRQERNVEAGGKVIWDGKNGMKIEGRGK